MPDNFSPSFRAATTQIIGIDPAVTTQINDKVCDVGYDWLYNPWSTRHYHFNKYFTANIGLEQLIEESGESRDEIECRLNKQSFDNGTYLITNKPNAVSLSNCLDSLTGAYDIIYYASFTESKRCSTRKGKLEIESKKKIILNESIEECYEIEGKVELNSSIDFPTIFYFDEMCRGNQVYVSPSDDHILENLITVPQVDIAFKDLVEWDRCGDLIRCGTIKIFSQKTAIKLNHKETCSKRRKINKAVDEGIQDIQDKENINMEHYKNTCSWLSKYKKLPIDITQIVGRYLSPPPYLFFEKGDLCIYLRHDYHPGYFIVARRVKKDNSST